MSVFLILFPANNPIETKFGTCIYLIPREVLLQLSSRSHITSDLDAVNQYDFRQIHSLGPTGTSHMLPVNRPEGHVTNCDWISGTDTEFSQLLAGPTHNPTLFHTIDGMNVPINNDYLLQYA